MKKFATALLLCIGMSLKCFSQNIYEDPSVEYTPQYFMDGSFENCKVANLIDLDSLYYNQPVNAGLVRTYCYLSHVMIGQRIGNDNIESNLKTIEESIGKDNSIYALALIPKAAEKEEDLGILLEAAEIIERHSGFNSWEYAFAMYMASSFTQDGDRYGGILTSLEYADKCISILEDEHKDSWLYKLAVVNRGAARMLNSDPDGFYEIHEAIKSFDTDNDSQKLIPAIKAFITFSTLLTMAGEHDSAILLLDGFDHVYNDYELQSTEMYMAANRTLCYAYAMKKDKKKAKIHYEKAEQACIERFGKGSRQYKSLQQYRTMF